MRLREALITAVTGWFLAKACIHPGIECTGTYALDTNVSGTTQSVAMPWAACAFPAHSPTLMNTQENARLATSITPNARTTDPKPACARKPTAEPSPRLTRNVQVMSAVSASERHARAEA